VRAGWRGAKNCYSEASSFPFWLQARDRGRSTFGITVLVTVVLSAGLPLLVLLGGIAGHAGGRAHVANFPYLGLFPGLVAATIETEPPEHAKLAAPLADLVRASREPLMGGIPGEPWPGIPFYQVPKSVADALRTRRMRVNRDGAVQVYILLDEVNEENLRRLQEAGAVLELKDPQRAIVQAHVSVGDLEKLEAVPSVQLVRLPNYGIPHTGSVDTEGDAILRANQVRSLLQVDGTGVRVGVISDGLKGVFAAGCTTCQGVAGGPIATGDLPNATGTRNAAGVLTASSGGITGRSFSADQDLEGLPPPSPPCGFPGAGAEGSALLEIVYDIAPGAQLFFANFDTSMAFKQAVNSLASETDVVVDDIGFFGEPYDGSSDVSTNTANALNSTTNPIRAYFTSVGNEADEHYLGAYLDSGTDGASIVGASGHLHLFQSTTNTVDVLGLGPQAYDKIELNAGGEVVVFLTWDDPFGSSTNDYDLFLVQENTGNVVASSTNKQCDGSRFPVECIDYTNETGAQGFFHVIIQNAGDRAAVKNLNMFLFEPECAQSGPLKLAPPRVERHNYNTVKSSISAQADAGGTPVSVVSVGAICSGSSQAIAVNPSCANDPDHTQIEFFSSNGPTVDARTKPDVAAIDGVSTTGAGNFENPFFGTSAAAPHAAGIAALLLQAAPCLRTGAAGARDNVTHDSPQPDPDQRRATGWFCSQLRLWVWAHRIDALASADATVPTAGAVPNQTFAGNTPTGATVTIPSTGFSDPNECPLTINATGGCNGSGSSVNCPFGTSTANLTATDNGVTLTAPVTVRITVSNFKVGVSPASATVTAGQTASYNVTATPQLGAFPGAITLGCSNLPGLSTCSFLPASVTPGTNAVSSTLTISTTAASALLPSPFMRWKAPPPADEVILVGLLLLLVFLCPSSVAKLGRRTRATDNKPRTADGLPESRMPKAEFRLRRIGYTACGVLLVLLLLQVSCGGSGSSGGSGTTVNPATPAGTYNIHITGTSGTLVQSASVNLVVQ